MNAQSLDKPQSNGSIFLVSAAVPVALGAASAAAAYGIAKLTHVPEAEIPHLTKVWGVAAGEFLAGSMLFIGGCCYDGYLEEADWSYPEDRPFLSFMGGAMTAAFAIGSVGYYGPEPSHTQANPATSVHIQTPLPVQKVSYITENGFLLSLR